MDSAKYLSAKVVRRKQVTDDLWSVRLRISGSFSFKPGQYATLAAEDGDGIHERPYSIVSSPFESELEFFLELVPEGEVTPRLYRMDVGDEIFVRKSAKGLFVFDQRSGHKNHLFVCTVTGIAPFLSMLRTWAADRNWAPPQTRVLLIDAASRSWEFGYREELLELERKLPDLQVVLSISRPTEDPEWHGELGRAEDLVRKYADSNGFTAGKTSAYLCGNPQMIENAKGILTRAGFDPKSIHEEIYWVPKKAEPVGVGS
jgi:ferredoxin--NADP+ reductase